jgi:hypothetical protein
VEDRPPDMIDAKGWTDGAGVAVGASVGGIVLGMITTRGADSSGSCGWVGSTISRGGAGDGGVAVAAAVLVAAVVDAGVSIKALDMAVSCMARDVAASGVGVAEGGIVDLDDVRARSFAGGLPFVCCCGTGASPFVCCCGTGVTVLSSSSPVGSEVVAAPSSSGPADVGDTEADAAFVGSSADGRNAGLARVG